MSENSFTYDQYEVKIKEGVNLGYTTTEMEEIYDLNRRTVYRHFKQNNSLKRLYDSRQQEIKDVSDYINETLLFFEKYRVKAKDKADFDSKMDELSQKYNNLLRFVKRGEVTYIKVCNNTKNFRALLLQLYDSVFKPEESQQEPNKYLISTDYKAQKVVEEKPKKELSPKEWLAEKMKNI